MSLNPMSAEEFNSAVGGTTLITQDVILENMILYISSHFRVATELYLANRPSEASVWHGRAV